MNTNGDKLVAELIDRAYRDQMVTIFRTFIDAYLQGTFAEYCVNKCKGDLVKLEWARTELYKIAKGD